MIAVGNLETCPPCVPSDGIHANFSGFLKRTQLPGPRSQRQSK